MSFETLAVLGGYEVLGILAIVLVIFGAKKIPELARGLGTGLKEFKKATSDVTSDLQRAIEDDYEEPRTPSQPRRPSSQPRERAEQSEPAASEAGTSGANRDSEAPHESKS